MSNPYLKSKVFENRIAYRSMWCSKERSGAKMLASNSIGDWSSPHCVDTAIDVAQAPPAAIVIVEPRQMCIASTSSTDMSTQSNGSESRHSQGSGYGIGGSSDITHPPEWLMLPQAVDVNNDVMRLVSSLSTVVQILTRMTSAAAQELRQHPEREEGFQGLRLLLNYADQMYTTLLQPQPLPSERQRNDRAPPTNLFHQLFEPMLRPIPERAQEVSARRLYIRSANRSARSHPYHMVAVRANAASSAAAGSEPGAAAAVSIGIRSNANQALNWHNTRYQ